MPKLHWSTFLAAVVFVVIVLFAYHLLFRK